MRVAMKVSFGAAAFAISCFTAMPCQAAIEFVTSQAALSGTDAINRESYGVPSFTNLLTTDGVGFYVTDPLVGGIFFDPRGPIALNDPTDFTPSVSAESLRIPYSNPNAEISINFLTPASAVGAQLENCNTNHNIGPTFTGYVSAFDGSTLLGTFSETNTIQNLQNGSAPFLSVVSNSADITSVEYYVTQNKEFFISLVSLRVTPLATAVPRTRYTVSARPGTERLGADSAEATAGVACHSANKRQRPAAKAGGCFIRLGSVGHFFEAAYSLSLRAPTPFISVVSAGELRAFMLKRG